MSASAADVWTAVTSLADIDPTAEYVLGYHENISKVPVAFTLMSKNPVAANLTQRGCVDSSKITFDYEANTVTNVPEDACIIKLIPGKVADTYSMYLENVSNPGYLAPITSRNANGMEIIPTEAPFKFEWLTDGENYDDELKYGYATTTFWNTLISDKDAKGFFTWTKMANFSLTYGTAYWMCMNQQAPGAMYLYKHNVTPPAATWSATPADKSTVKTLPLFEIKWDDVTAIDLNMDEDDFLAAYTATFNDADIMINPMGLFENPMVVQFARQYPQTEGQFKFTLPEGALLLTKADGSKVESPEIKYSVYVQGLPLPVTVSATPANGSRMVEFASATLDYANASKIQKGEGNISATFNGAALNPIVMPDLTKAYISFTNNISTPGTLVINVPADAFKVYNTDEELVEMEAMTLTYKVLGDLPEMNFTATPEPGRYKSYPEVTLTYTDATEVKVPEGATAELAIGSTKHVLNVSGNGNTVTFTSAAPITDYIADYTTYSLNVAQGTYTVVINGQEWPNAEVAIKDYKVSAPTLDFTVNPEPGLYGEEPEFGKLFNTLTFTLTDATSSSINVMKKAQLFKVNAAGENELLANYTGFNAKASGNTVTANLYTAGNEEMEDDDELEIEAGEYRVVIAAGFFSGVVNGKTVAVTETTLEYTLVSGATGVQGAFEENPEAVIYNMNGVRIYAKDAANLPAGLYIVNGKKTLRK